LAVQVTLFVPSVRLAASPLMTGLKTTRTVGVFDGEPPVPSGGTTRVLKVVLTEWPSWLVTLSSWVNSVVVASVRGGA
jgi:hypothetical protein